MATPSEEEGATRPVLQARSAGTEAPPDASDAGPAGPPAGAVAQPIPPEAGDTSPLGELIAEIQREVEPATWMPPSTAAIKSHGEGVLVVRAPRAVQESLYEFLESRRAEVLRTMLPADPGDPPGTQDALREPGELELRRLLQGMLRQWERLELALRARRESRLDEAVRQLDEVLLEEPDHQVALEYRKLLLEPPAPKSPVVDRSASGSGLERAEGPYAETEARVRAIAPSRIPRWVMAWPSRATYAALERARRDAQMPHWTLRGAERERRLGLPAPLLTLAGTDLLDALRNLSYATLIDLSVDPLVLIPLQVRTLPPLAPADPSLEALLRAIAAAMGPNLRFIPYSTVLELTATDGPPSPEVRIFDVGDLVAPEPERGEPDAVRGVR